MSEEPIRILSADAPKGGLRECAKLFSEETGIPHSIELATGPTIKRRILEGDTEPDLIIIPRFTLDDLAAAGKIEADGITLMGYVAVGVTIRKDGVVPDLDSVDGFVASVLAADRIIYNTASSGVYIAEVFNRLGLADKIKDKVSIYPTGKTTMEALAEDTSGNAIGFGHVTEIRLHDPLGTQLVGPLPKEIGRLTPYAAGLLVTSRNPDKANQLVALMSSLRGKQIFAENGVAQE